MSAVCTYMSPFKILYIFSNIKKQFECKLLNITNENLPCDIFTSSIAVKMLPQIKLYLTRHTLT